MCRIGYSALATRRGSFGVRWHGQGDGPVVLCQHGFPDDASTFDELAANLADAGLRVAAVNLRGYAPSPLDGSLDLPELVADLLAVIDELSPDAPVGFVGHDFGAQLGYPAMASAPHRFAAAVLLAGAHPAFVTRNARRSLRQLWASRYLVFFQLGALADRAVARDDFAYVEKLWRRWAPGFTPPEEHLTRVKATLAASMPAPTAMYRAGGFNVAEQPIAVPTLVVNGADDGCARPFLGDGQERLFTAAYRAETWPATGHFPHLEHPDRSAESIRDWLLPHLATVH
jgi:pimeloyl-ACP methyl ester carboxylesterase